MLQIPDSDIYIVWSVKSASWTTKWFWYTEGGTSTTKSCSNTIPWQMYRYEIPVRFFRKIVRLDNTQNICVYVCRKPCLLHNLAWKGNNIISESLVLSFVMGVRKTVWGISLKDTSHLCFTIQSLIFSCIRQSFLPKLYVYVFQDRMCGSLLNTLLM